MTVAIEQDVSRIEEAMGELQRLWTSRRMHDDHMQAIGVRATRTELRVLRWLVSSSPTSVSDVAAALDVSQPTASRTLAGLERQGLVARQATADGRVTLVEITPEGRRTMRRVARYRHRQLEMALGGMADGQRHRLALSLEDLVERLRGSSSAG